jgi:hypothetical protein
MEDLVIAIESYEFQEEETSFFDENGDETPFLQEITGFDFPFHITYNA